MPEVASRSGGRRGRRAMSEMNMVPFIDVMLVLLIIFMVSAPLITTGVVDLPSVGQVGPRASRVIEVIVSAEGALQVRADQADPQPVALTALPGLVRQLQGGNAAVPVVISADKAVRYESVVQAMDVLQRAGVQRVGLSVQQGR